MSMLSVIPSNMKKNIVQKFCLSRINCMMKNIGGIEPPASPVNPFLVLLVTWKIHDSATKVMKR